MDWLYILMPIAGIKILWPGLIILGLGVGIIGGFFGMGGAWMVTPGLNILGFPMAFAIGTDIAHMAGKSLDLHHAPCQIRQRGLQARLHHGLGGTIGGLESGAQMIMWLERIGEVDIVCALCLSRPADPDRLDGLCRCATKRRMKERDALAAGKASWTSCHRPGVAQDPAQHPHSSHGPFPKRPSISLLGLAADFRQLLHRLAGRRPGHRRRPDPHAGSDLLHRLSPRTWRWARTSSR